MGRAAMYIPCSVECDACGKELELAYRIDLHAAARSRAKLKRDSLASIEREVLDAAKAQGWTVIGAKSLCPECTEASQGACTHKSRGDVTARGLVSDAVMILRSRRAGAEGGEAGPR